MSVRVNDGTEQQCNCCDTVPMAVHNYSSPIVATKLRLYWVFILLVILHGAETWSPTRQLVRNLDVLDQWCLCRILCISWRAHISNEEVRRHTDHWPATTHTHHPYHPFFGHIARADPSMDHSGTLKVCVAPLLGDWNCQSGRLHHTWLRMFYLISHHLT